MDIPYLESLRHLLKAVDTWDGMRHDRPYSKGISVDMAVARMLDLDFNEEVIHRVRKAEERLVLRV